MYIAIVFLLPYQSVVYRSSTWASPEHLLERQNLKPYLLSMETQFSFYQDHQEIHMHIKVGEALPWITIQSSVQM